MTTLIGTLLAHVIGTDEPRNRLSDEPRNWHSDEPRDWRTDDHPNWHTDGLPPQVLHSLEQAALGASTDAPPPLMRPARSFFSDLRLLELRQCMMNVLELQVR